MSDEAIKTKKAWDELVQSCPLLFRGESSFGFECSAGWHAVISKLCLGIEKLIVAMPEAERFQEEAPGELLYGVAQVKEKFGTLRFYMHCESEGMTALIDAAEGESAKTCETCGKPGVLRTDRYWIYTSCDDCYGGPPTAE